MKKQLLLLVMMTLPLLASAYDIEVKNADGVTIYYNYINDGNELEVTFCSSFYITDSYKGNVVVPEEVTYMNRTRKVTSIGDNAFWYCSGLISVTIPNSVISVGEMAFIECTGLKKVIVSDIAAWCSIRFSDYSANPLLYANHLYSDENTEIKNLVIPNSVTSICNYAFFGCSGLTSITIPNSVTSIGNRAFSGCSGLTSITIPNSVTSIGNEAFRSCSGLTSVTISNSVTSIGDKAFSGCSGITSITIPNSVTSIGEGAFDGVDIPTIISQIENPFAIYGKTSNNRTFTLNTFNNATLYVPKSTIDKYKATEGWKDFVYIEEGTGGGGTTPEKCEKPTISYKNGKLTFASSTEGATCQSTITDADIKSYSGNEIQLGVTYVINVYATKAGCENSETATATLCWIDVEPKTEGIADGVAQIAARPVLVKTDNGFITVEGVDDRTNVSVYTTDGKQVGSAISQNNIATIATSIQPGSIAIVKIGEQSVKVVIK